MAVDDAGDDVGEVAVRLDVEELAGLDQRSDHRPVLGTAIRAGEECVLAIKRERADGAFDDVVIDFDPAILKEEAEARPTGQGIADCLSELGLLADQGELGAQPGFQVINDRPAAVLADGAALIGIAAADRLGNR